MHRHGQSILFLTVGVALVAASILMDQVKYGHVAAIALNLGLVSIAVVVVERLWRASGGHPIERQVSSLAGQVTRLSETIDIVDQSMSVGLKNVYDCQANFGTLADWERLMRESEGRVDLMGRTLFGWTRSPDLEKLIRRKIENDHVRFRWLIMSRTNRYLPLLTEETINIGSILEKKIQEVETRLSKIREDLPENLKELLQVRQFDHVPLYCAITRVDDSCYTTPYLFGASADASPLLRLKGVHTPWFQRYMKEFEIVWGDSADFFGDEGTDDKNKALSIR